MTTPSDVNDDDDLLSSYTFELPAAQIAQRPLPDRKDARLLVLHRDVAVPEHRHVRDLPSLLRPHDVLVVNDTTVIPARLHGEKANTGGKVELLLVRRVDERRWVCLVNASKRPKPGARIVLSAPGGDALLAAVEAPVPDEPGAWVVGFEGDALAFANAHGHVPLPPYIARADDADDVARYQTVFHDDGKPGSSAAPTAGLHFDDALLAAVRARGVALAKVTLHVGPGTFLPVRGDRLSEHAMHAEPWVVSEEAASAIAAARARGGRVIAVGTTSLRCLESAVDDEGRVRAGSGLTRLFIKPGHRFAAVDAMVTNFHLPGSTLFVLVSAVVGKTRMRAAYEEAIRTGYRFYSYGDACFLEVA